MFSDYSTLLRKNFNDTMLKLTLLVTLGLVAEGLQAPVLQRGDWLRLVAGTAVTSIATPALAGVGEGGLPDGAFQ